MGVWIETQENEYNTISRLVTPCVGVWIETRKSNISIRSKLSHPAWVCGLKLCILPVRMVMLVTPCVGVWIETGIDRRGYHKGERSIADGLLAGVDRTE